jgi:hypothetical protein
MPRQLAPILLTLQCATCVTSSTKQQQQQQQHQTPITLATGTAYKNRRKHRSLLRRYSSNDRVCNVFAHQTHRAAHESIAAATLGLQITEVLH